jgi:Holliday junction DNA helicase RuvA
MERALFERLIGVSGIGPTLAIKVLSGVAADDLVRIIRMGEVQMLTRVPGIGKKTAERIVLELRDKMEGLGQAPTVNTAPGVTAMSTEERDVVSALVNLGCQQAAAEAAVRKALQEKTEPAFEPLFRRAMELLR